MKFRNILAISLLSVICTKAAAAKDYAGTYDVCEPWTTFNNVQTSRLFELEVTGWGNLEFRTYFYKGNQECLGEIQESAVVTDLLTIDSVDGLMITAFSPSRKLYYRAMFGKENALLQIGERLPLEVDLDHLPFGLKRKSKNE